MCIRDRVNGVSRSNGLESDNHSDRKYISHIFERKDYYFDMSDEDVQSPQHNVTKHRSRDLPLLNIERSYSADESESESASSDQGTVKLKDLLADSNDNTSADKNTSGNTILLKSSQQIPRSISGQVLTDEEDQSSSDDDQGGLNRCNTYRKSEDESKRLKSNHNSPATTSTGTNSGAASTANDPNVILPNDRFTEDNVKALMGYGFSREVCIQELRAKNGDERAATAALFARSLKM